MTTTQQMERLGRLAAKFQGHCPELRSQHHIVDSLSVGLTHLRDLFMVRAHDDVEQEYGADSMVATSLANMQRQTRTAKIEIEAYSCIVVDDEVTENGHVNKADQWFLDWIFRLRLGEGCRSVVDKRVGYYSSRTNEERRLKFVSLLQRTMPQSARAPLVLFRLFPRSVRVSAAVAFGDPLRAQELRAEQIRFLPAIGDCHECHGRVLDNEEICRCCGNPVWNFTWLLSD
jgi:hypothetical protein